MDKDVSAMLDRSPHPLPWMIAMFVLIGLATYLQSVIIGILAGVSIGAYFGDYRGRFAVIEAWRLQTNKDYEEQIAKLEARYRQ